MVTADELYKIFNDRLAASLDICLLRGEEFVFGENI